jgi:DNA-binding CsgD family transcriptional regulator
MDKDSAIEAKRIRVKNLGPAEYEVYLWLREAYSLPWIAETLFIEKRELKRRTARLLKSLGVKNQYELIQQYGALDKPLEKLTKAVKCPIRTEELCMALVLYQEERGILNAS